MSHFIELETPKLDTIPDLWYVLARHDRIYLTKYGDLEHEDFIDTRDIGKIYYESELQAYEAIDEYYDMYNRQNPYLTQWQSAKILSVAEDAINDAIESQVMEFE